MAISIVLADDHPLVRRGVRAVFETQKDFSVVGMAGDGLETLGLVERLRPDVLILDLMLPSLSGLEILRILRERLPRVRVVILSIYNNKAFIAQALAGGAIGYVLKGCPEENLVEAVRHAALGRRFLSPPITDLAIKSYMDQAQSGVVDPHEALTGRQREVLQLVAEGRTSAEIAKKLGISPRTVENHRASLVKTLGIQNRTDLVRHALKYGLLPPSEDL